MIKIERLLQINIAALVALGTLLVGMEQRNSLLPMLSLLAAVTSVIFTDILRWFRLNGTIASIAALLAVAMFILKLLRYDAQYLLISIASLLVYLQIILLFQEKNHRLYGHLLVLSLLQVVAASAVNLNIQFGILLVLYMFSAFCALYLSFLHRESQRYAARSMEEGSRRPETAARLSAARRDLPRAARFPLPTRGALQPIATYDDLTHALAGWGILRQVLSMGLSTLVFTVVLFFTLPRFGEAVWQGPRGGGTGTIGFTNEVSLEEIGRLLDNEDLVMRVHFYDQQGKSYPVTGDPYFRGSILWNYAEINGRRKWVQQKLTPARGVARFGPPPAEANVVLQSVVLEPSREGILFSVFPPYETSDSTEKVQYEAGFRRLRRKKNTSTKWNGQFRYSLTTTAFESGWQQLITPHSNHMRSRHDKERMEEEKQLLLRFDSQEFQGLKEKADAIVRSANIAAGDQFAAACVLERHFTRYDQYRYTTDFDTVQRNPDLDPIEDFVTGHKSGHCEYFASALVMMLRSQGIPARVVVGYKGGEYNAIGKYFLVRQRDAHAWVEAYLERDQVPTSMAGTHDIGRAGAWLRLDPTPATLENEIVLPAASILAPITQSLDYAQIVWREYVLGLNSARQRESIYLPLVACASDILKALIDREAWATFLVGLRSGKWFHWRAGLITVLALLVAVGLYRLLRQFPARFRQWQQMHRLPARTPASRRVEFYDRMKRLLARHGMQSAVGQTPREFAIDVGGQLADSLPRRQAASLPRRIVDAFYHVRYGGRPLDEQQLATVDRALSILEETLVKEAN